MEEPPSRQSFEILLITMEPRGIGVSAIRLTINYIQCQESRGGTAFSPKIYSISSKTEWVEEMHMPKRPVHLTKPGSIRVKIVFFFSDNTRSSALALLQDQGNFNSKAFIYFICYNLG